MRSAVLVVQVSQVQVVPETVEIPKLPFDEKIMCPSWCAHVNVLWVWSTDNCGSQDPYDV